MKFVRAIAGFNHLWAVRDEAKEADELTMLFREWSNANYLLDFFLANIDDLQGFFHVEKISDAIKDTMEDARALERLILDFPYTEQLDGLFHPLSLTDNRIHELTCEKARNWDRERHASWLRIYAIRIEPNVYIWLNLFDKLSESSGISCKKHVIHKRPNCLPVCFSIYRKNHVLQPS